MMESWGVFLKFWREWICSEQTVNQHKPERQRQPIHFRTFGELESFLENQARREARQAENARRERLGMTMIDVTWTAD